MEKLSSSKFSWDNAGIRLGYTLHDVFNKNWKLKPGISIEGYGECKDFSVRPSSGKAILFFNGDEEFWLHVSDYDFEILLKEIGNEN